MLSILQCSGLRVYLDTSTNRTNEQIQNTAFMDADPHVVYATRDFQGLLGRLH